jgi:hypothetical protein
MVLIVAYNNLIVSLDNFIYYQYLMRFKEKGGKF